MIKGNEGLSHQPVDKSPWIFSAWGTGAVLLLLTVAAVAEGYASIKLAPALLGVGSLLYLYLIILLTGLSSTIRSWIQQDRQRAFFCAAALLLPYWIFARGTDTFSYWGSLKLAGFIYLPLLFMNSASLDSDGKPSWQWYAAVGSLWLPFDFRLLDYIWMWPEGVGAYSINTIIAILTALLVFFAVGNLDGLRLPLTLRESEIKMVIRYTASFCAIAIPLALDSHFISFVPTFAPWKFIAVPVGIFFFVALPEELLFRGLLQNLLVKQWRHPLKAILVTSFIFGLSHINNKPTWSLSYVGLATLAGMFYGAAYEKTKNLFVSALIHCAVDSIWILLFFGRG